MNSTLGSGFFSDEILEMIWSMNSFGECEKKLSKTDPQIRKNELSSKRIILLFIKKLEVNISTNTQTIAKSKSKYKNSDFLLSISYKKNQKNCWKKERKRI